MGLGVDEERNQALVGREGEISADGSRMRALVIPTDEERIIARDTLRLVTGAPKLSAPRPRASRI